jgi:hypothetical protein
MSDQKFDPKPLVLDSEATSASTDQPAFMSKPAGSPVYHGFPLIPETYKDGWCFGAITDFQDPSGCTWGDGFVQAPDGSRAGLVWQVGNGSLSEIMPPEPDRWGVYAIYFPRPVSNLKDLRECFEQVLPQLRERYEQIKSPEAS